MKTSTRIKRLAEKAEQQPLLPIEHAGPGRGHTTRKPRGTKGGNSRDYLLRRLARDHPAILERLKAGEFATVRDAAREAGIVKDTRQAPPHDLEDCAQALIASCPQALREGIKAAVERLQVHPSRLIQGALAVWLRSRDNDAPRATRSRKR